MPLTMQTAARAVKLGGLDGKAKVADGAGLYLWCRNGRGFWNLCRRDKATGNTNAKVIGRFPEMSPMQARAIAGALKLGVAMPARFVPAPIEAETEQAAAPVETAAKPSSGTFGYWVDQYLADKPGPKEWTADTIGKRTRWLKVRCKELHAFPIETITREQIAKVVQPLGVWDSVGERARLIIQYVFDHADIVNSPATVARLKKLLKARHGKATPQPSMPWQHVPEFMASLDDSPGARSLKFLILTGVRRGNVLGATWSEFNLTDRYISHRDGKPIAAGKATERDIQPWSWNISGDKTKNELPHRVPLSKAMLDVLGTPGEPAASVFGVDKHPMEKLCKHQPSDHATRSAVPHGFRTTVKQWAIKQGVGREVSESLIQHKLAENEAEAAYDRDDRFAERIPIMQKWGEYATSR